MSGIHEKREEIIRSGLPMAFHKQDITVRQFMNGASLYTYRGRAFLELDAPNISFEPGNRLVIRQGYRYIENLSTRQ